jgi:hypothetical protein
VFEEAVEPSKSGQFDGLSAESLPPDRHISGFIRGNDKQDWQAHGLVGKQSDLRFQSGADFRLQAA